VGSIWIVDPLIYPSWPMIGPVEVDAVRAEHWHRLPGVVFLPAGLALAVAVAMVRLRPPGVPGRAVRLGLALQVAASLVTAVWFAPLQARMSTPEGGLSGPVFRQLATTHRVRVAIITAYGALTFWMVAKGAWPEGGGKRTDA